MKKNKAIVQLNCSSRPNKPNWELNYIAVTAKQHHMKQSI